MWALAEIVKAQAGIFETDEPGTADEKLVKTVDALEFDGDRAWLISQLRPLLGVGGTDAAQSNRDEQFAAWQQFLESLAETSPAVLIFEDLHWADDLLLDFLDEFADRASGVPLLLVCTARPELLTKRPNWGAGRTNALTLSLPPLSADNTKTLVRELVASSIPDELQQGVLERAEGNPLYAEEFARMLAENPTADIVIPDTVQGILAARLDALTVDQKRLLQAAAVFGKVFWAGALAAAVGKDRAAVEQSLRDLERRELIRRDRRSSVAGDIEYAFRHILVRDVAYGQIARPDRAELHRKAAEWISALGRPDDYAELVAHHYTSAFDFARAANRDTDSFVDATRHALRTAGDRATALGAHASATEFYRRALELAVDETERAELLVAYGTAQWDASGAGLEALSEGARELERMDRSEDAADALIAVGRIEAISGRSKAAERALDDADRMMADFPGSVTRYRSLLARAALRVSFGRNAEADELLTPHLEDIERLGRPDLFARALDLAGSARATLGDAAAMELQRRAAEIARAGRAVGHLHSALNNLSASILISGRLSEAEAIFDQRQEAFDTFGSSADARLFLLTHRVWQNYFIGAWDVALDLIDEMSRTDLAGGMFLGMPSTRCYGAIMRAARDEHYDPRPEVTRQLAAAVAQSADLRLDMLPEAADALATGGALDEALPLWQEAQANALTGEASINADQTLHFAWAAVALGREADALEALPRLRDPVWRAAALDIARHEFDAAADKLTEMGHKVGAARAGIAARGDRVVAAVEFFRSIGATRYVAMGEAALRGDDLAR
jgi:hypothetical protein